MFGSGRPSMIAFTLKLAVAVGVLSYFAADIATRGFDRDGLARIAERERIEPLTTGSLANLGGSRVDPCTVPGAH